MGIGIVVALKGRQTVDGVVGPQEEPSSVAKALAPTRLDFTMKVFRTGIVQVAWA